ncbi:MAG: recombinase family protein, partial [Clostridiales bacterium]|nr:recombinase family protein [Clostridiales bacterium]
TRRSPSLTGTWMQLRRLLSRNYLEAGKMIEEFFPRHGVRYIALNDGIDTMLDNNDIAPFKNILNEFYSRDISKKVHASYYLKATRGDFTGCVAPFGYVKDPQCKNHLLIDEETAPIVRRIFDYALEGRGPGYIRRRLEMDEIPCPTWWNRQRGIRSHFTKWELADPEKGRFLWDDTVIKDMLINPVYMGCMASQKKNYHFKIGTIGEKKPEDWIIVEGTHEAIVTAEEFEIVQQKLKVRQRPRDNGNFSLFAGLIKCGECGKALTIRKTNAKNPKDIYACVTYNRYGKHHCTQHRIEYDVLYDMVLSKIQECATAALADDEDVLDQLSESFRSEQEGQLQAIARQVAKDTERLSLLDRMVVKLYEDMIAGRISEANFNLMMKKAQDEQMELTDRVKHNKELLTDQNKLTRDNQQWLDMIREYADIQELDTETLQKLIREITVHEDIDEGGTRNITAEIHFNLKPLPEPMGDSEPASSGRLRSADSFL